MNIKEIEQKLIATIVSQQSKGTKLGKLYFFQLKYKTVPVTDPVTKILSTEQKTFNYACPLGCLLIEEGLSSVEINDKHINTDKLAQLLNTTRATINGISYGWDYTDSYSTGIKFVQKYKPKLESPDKEEFILGYNLGVKLNDKYYQMNV